MWQNRRNDFWWRMHDAPAIMRASQQPARGGGTAPFLVRVGYMGPEGARRRFLRPQYICMGWDIVFGITVQGVEHDEV